MNAAAAHLLARLTPGLGPLLHHMVHVRAVQASTGRCWWGGSTLLAPILKNYNLISCFDFMDAGQETHIGGIAAVAAVVSAAVRRPNPQHDRASDSLCFVCPLRSCLMYAGCVDCSSHLSSSLQPGPWFSYARSSLDACSCACRAVPWPSMICRFYTGLACFVKYHVFERAGCHINVDWWVRG